MAQRSEIHLPHAVAASGTLLFLFWGAAALPYRPVRSWAVLLATTIVAVWHLDHAASP